LRCRSPSDQSSWKKFQRINVSTYLARSIVANVAGGGY